MYRHKVRYNLMCTINHSSEGRGAEGYMKYFSHTEDAMKKLRAMIEAQK